MRYVKIFLLQDDNLNVFSSQSIWTFLARYTYIYSIRKTLFTAFEPKSFSDESNSLNSSIFVGFTDSWSPFYRLRPLEASKRV